MSQPRQSRDPQPTSSEHPQMGALRQALESADRSVRAAAAALDRTKAELTTERMRRAQLAEQCERVIAALNDLRAENKRLRLLVAEKGGGEPQ